MRRCRDLIGLPVMSLLSARQVGVVRGVVLGRENTHVVGVIVAEHSKGRRAHVVLFEDIRTIGRDAVMVEGDAVCLDASLEEPIGRTGDMPDGGMRVLTQSGKEIGVIRDVVFDPRSGQVGGYELSRGVLGDLLEGRLVMNLPEGWVVGDGVIIIPDEDRKGRAGKG